MRPNKLILSCCFSLVLVQKKQTNILKLVDNGQFLYSSKTYKVNRLRQNLHATALLLP